MSALQMLARRELSEAQIRQRLARKGHAAEDIDVAVERLRGERAINDARVAEAIAHTEISLRSRGKLRVRRQIEQAGIDASTARHAIDEAYGAIDDEALLEASLAKRLRGRAQIGDRKEFERLYRYLASQGFEPDRILRVLKARSVK